MESTRRSEGCSELHWVPGPGCCGPSSSHTSPVRAALASSLGQGRSGPLVGILHSWRSPVRTCCASSVSNGGDYRPKGSLLTQLSCVALYKRWHRWSKTVLTFFSESVLRNFAKGVLELFRWTSGFSQRQSHPWVVVKNQHSLRLTIEDSYSAVLLVSSVQLLFLWTWVGLCKVKSVSY